MWLRSRSARLLLWAVLLAVFTVRASDTHLHLCFDGLEPPTTVHFADASVHDDEHRDGETHADRDFDPLAGALLKHGGSDADPALPTYALATVLLLPPPGTIVPAAASSLPADTGSPLHLRPPLRGPPA
jgi:hypothetical protein